MHFPHVNEITVLGWEKSIAESARVFALLGPLQRFCLLRYCTRVAVDKSVGVTAGFDPDEHEKVHQADLQKLCVLPSSNLAAILDLLVHCRCSRFENQTARTAEHLLEWPCAGRNMGKMTYGHAWVGVYV